mgnify:CR=1 FL=1
MAEKLTKRKKETRTRNWTCIVYPDSTPENWIDILNDMHIEFVISPLHDQDKNANGELKKPHWHVMLMFGGVKTYDQVKEITDQINCPRPERCHNAKAMVRYMAHLDNPDKAQYKIEDIRAYGGVDLQELLRPTSSERYSIIREMIDYVRNEHIIELQDLIDYAISERYDDWFPLLCDSCTYVINQYIKSIRHRVKPKVDMETGEIQE